MLIFWDARLVLLAVPKTGTTALEASLATVADVAILGPPGLKHCTASRYRRDLRGFFELRGRRPLELVAVMREPVSWLSSWFRYRSRPTLHGLPNSTAGLDFGTFVDAYLSEAPPDFARVGSQATFLEGGVDHLFRHDRMADLTTFLAGRLGRPVDLSRENVSPPGDAALAAPLLARLCRERAADFALWRSLGT